MILLKKNRGDVSNTESRQKGPSYENARKEVTGPVSIYAIAEMNRRAEEYTLKVRSELFRIGCGTDGFQVLRQGTYIQIKYHNQIILADPSEVLMVLRKTSVGLDAEDVWGRVNQNVRQMQRENQLRIGWSFAIFGMLIAGAIACFFWLGT